MIREPLPRDPLFSIFDRLEENNETGWAYEAQHQKNEIACVIVNFRVEKGWSQQELADYLGVSQSMISKYESGDYNFSIESLNRISSKIGLKTEIRLVKPDAGTSSEIIVRSDV
ncbi:MAG: helix-turn-helix domain-containing protein [Clostridia bacterium]|nr:helix-turn-helix domain-containing protein [Clostridia bacterium]